MLIVLNISSYFRPPPVPSTPGHPSLLPTLIFPLPVSDLPCPLHPLTPLPPPYPHLPSPCFRRPPPLASPPPLGHAPPGYVQFSSLHRCCGAASAAGSAPLLRLQRLHPPLLRHARYPPSSSLLIVASFFRKTSPRLVQTTCCS